MAENQIELTNPELIMLQGIKEDGYNYRQRRDDDWTENYTLYRDKVEVNRLEQRQSVNIPLMKTQLRTLLKDVDDMPILYFENIDNDKGKEIFQNEYWKKTVEWNKMEVQDIVDKRQVFHFGRSFDQWQIVDGKICMTVTDPADILVSRYTKPYNVHSSRFLVHTHIFVPLSSLANNPDYDQTEVLRLQTFYATQQGLIKAADNFNTLQKKNEKLAELGVPDIDSPILGETYVELSLCFVYRENEKDSEGKDIPKQIFLYVEAESTALLMKKPLEEVMGVTKDHYFQDHYPYVTWADDVDMQDFWTDGIADIIRTPNKILNSFFSQMVENRTLRNFSMYFYDATNENFNPGTFQPVPFGFYPIPGKPSEIMQRIEIPDLSESLDEMQFLITMVEKATGATSTQQGTVTPSQITLGEIKLALGEAKERVKGMAKFYIPAWKERGDMFLHLIEAGADKLDDVKIYKKGRNTSDIYSQTIGPKDWMTKSGYLTKVWTSEEKLNNDTNQLQKLNAVKTFMPENSKLDEVYKRKLLSFADLAPDEINDIMQEEVSRLEMMKNQPDPNQVMPAGGGARPAIMPSAGTPTPPPAVA